MADVLTLLFQQPNMSTALRGTAFVALHIVNKEHVLTAQQKTYLENLGDKSKK
jgi:hypothetical protein